VVDDELVDAVDDVVGEAADVDEGYALEDVWSLAVLLASLDVVAFDAFSPFCFLPERLLALPVAFVSTGDASPVGEMRTRSADFISSAVVTSFFVASTGCFPADASLVA